MYAACWLLPSINIVVRKFAGFFAVFTAALVAAAPAWSATGYELDASDPEVPLGGQALPHGIDVDQVSRRVYVAVASRDPFSATPGDIARFESDLTPAGTFAAAGDPYYSGVAVNPLTQGLYAAQEVLETPKGDLGTARMDVFSAAGAFGSSFALSDNGTLPDLAADSAGNVYYPSAATGSVRVFDSSGALQGEIDCGGCDGGVFGRPVSVALDSAGDLYVVDLNPDRVVKLTDSGGGYAFDSLLQSGRGAAAVAVDPGTDDVFVGDLPNGRNYHVVAYDSAGTEFDDFGAGLFTDPEPRFGAAVAAQIAADATSHRLYVGELGKFYVFERTTIAPPDVTTEAPTPVGQIEATLKATVNANGHAALECEFEHTDKADFEANGFTNATAEPCPEKPDGLDDTALSLSLSGLSPATSYVYRVSATSHAGSDSGAPIEFETLPVVAPTVTPEPASAVTQTSATIRARVNPQGGSVTDCHFEFGTTAAYGSSLPCPTVLGPVSSDVSQARGVDELAHSTTYHYRLVVSSNAGTTEGEDVEFTTDDPPPPEPDDDGDSGDAPPPPPPALVPLLPAIDPVVTAQRPLRCRKGFRKRRVRGKVRCVQRCRRGFKRRLVRREVRCLNRCRRGFRKKRFRVRRKGKPRRVVRCVKKRGKRAIRRQRARARRR